MIARSLRVSASTVSHALGKTGLGFWPRVHEARIALAKELIATTNEPMKAIAWDVGYRHAQDFSAKFREIVGLAPKVYGRRLVAEVLDTDSGRQHLRRDNRLSRTGPDLPM